ncbi:MAG: RNA-metabolising metallo-beta-lactamase [Thermoleophilia bacterium]|nr:RNA-metabolising metallo-beta-lactamase [Thermoleophilia bacterium]
MPDPASNAPVVRVIPLGGIGEIGKNISVIECGDDLIVIDCGLTFPREEGMFGVDIVLPDFTYLAENASRIRALVLTHAHEDHIGAVPYLLRDIKIPQVLATRLTLALVKSKVDEFGLLNATEWVEVVPEDDPVQVGCFELEFVRVAHSVPDGVAVATHTPHGTIFHTGDLKLDPSPLDGVPTDLGHIAEIGSDGIALYFADSTQADVPGHTRSERTLAGPLRDLCSKAPGRIIATCFSSHIHRIQQFVDIAKEEGRSVCILGRSMTRNTNIAKNLGYLDADDVTFIKPNQIENLAPDKVMVLCTGSQGEPLAALSRFAAGTHHNMQPNPTDTVIFSSRTIPGNDNRVHRIQNGLAKVGTQIYSSDNAHVHVSGHGSSAELLTLLQLVRPTTFVPVHGEWRHMRAHAELGKLVGITEENIFLIENGTVVELRDGAARLTGEFVTVGAQLVDRTSNDEILDDVLEERQMASGDGVLVVVAHENSGTLELISRGFVTDDGDLLDDARTAAEDSLTGANGTRLDDAALSKLLQEAVEGIVHQRSRQSPLVVPVVLGD